MHDKDCSCKVCVQKYIDNQIKRQVVVKETDKELQRRVKSYKIPQPRFH